MANQYNNKVTLQNGTALVVDGTGASESQVVSINDVPNTTGTTAVITGVAAPEGSISIYEGGATWPTSITIR